jgi:hypothetical protein
LEDIKAIIKLLTKQKIRQIEILSEESKMSEKSKKLYSGIKDGSISNDDDAAQLLYNTDSKNAKYRVFKNRFKQRLINTLFFIDIQAYGRSTYNKVLNRSYKNWAATKILMDKSMSKNAISIMETILKSSLKYDLEELSLLMVRDIKLHYGLYNYKKTKFQKYQLLYNNLTTIVEYKSQAEEYYIYFGHLISTNKSISYSSEIKLKEKSLLSLSKKAMKIDSYFLRYQLYMSLYILYLIKKNLKQQLIISQEAIKYFNSKKGFHNYGKGSFLQINGLVQLGLGNFDESLKTFYKCFEVKPIEGRLFWQSIHNYIFLIHVLKKDYNKAYEILSYILNHKTFKNIYNDFQQQWYLKHAFIYFLIRTGKINPEEIEVQKLKSFRFNKFLNDTTTLSKDKRGFNITIHVIQILYFIMDEKYDELLDKMTSLKQYSFRYLKADEYLRSRTFIKMLITIPEQSYNLKKILKKTKSLQEILSSHPMDYSEQAMSIEIIPYEQLWEEVLELL